MAPDSDDYKPGLKADPRANSWLQNDLLKWYELSRRDLPWRRTRDPYAIWVSEIMLQQTRVAAVIGRYESFLRNFPTVSALAHAAEQDVLAEWSGLGYYRRARMLHQAAKVVALELRGKMPKTAAGLRELPGIGAYTSAAIASIAFLEPIAVVDGNVERVIQRLEGWGSEAAADQRELARRIDERAQALVDRKRPGDFNQAMMELGATICLPKGPNCLICPVLGHCATRGEHPTRKRAKMVSKDAGHALVIRSVRVGRERKAHREVLLDQRPSDVTVMAGMWELPTLKDLNVPGDMVLMSVRHAIMQVNYYVRIREVAEELVEELTAPAVTRRWVELRKLGTIPLTGLTRKVLLRAKLAELKLTPVIEGSGPIAEDDAEIFEML